MKKTRTAWILIGVVLAWWVPFLEGESQSLEDLYKTGKIRLVPEVRIADENLPDDVYFQMPSGLAVDGQGRFFIVDYNAHHIKTFDSKGTFSGTLGRQGQGPGEFEGPYRICLAGDSLIIYELSARRLSRLRFDGTHEKSAPLEFTEGSLRSLRGLPDGRLVVEREKSYFWQEDRPQDCRIDIFSKELRPVNKLEEAPIRRNSYITKPVRTNVPQPFYNDVIWDTTPEGKVVVGLSGTYEICLYDPDNGKIKSFSHDFEPVKVTKKDKDSWFAGMTYSSSDGQRKEGAADFVVKNTNFPRTKPAFHSLLVDPEGNILVFTHSEDKVNDTTYFDAFDPDGRFINRVEIVGENPINYTTIRAGNGFASIITGEDQLYRIILYKIAGGSD